MIISRRLFLGTVAAGGASLAAPHVIRPSSAQSNEVWVCSYGGIWTKAETKAFFEPFTKETGIAVKTVSPVSFAKLRAQVENKAYEWDLTCYGEGDIVRAHNEGFTEPLDWSVIDKGKLWEGAQVGDALRICRFAMGMSYRADKFPNGGPQNWVDFWNVDAFPGPRGMLTNSPRVMIFALRADGVPADKIYPIDIDRAFRSLDRIKKHVKVWWQQGRQFEQLMTDAEVYASAAWYEGVEQMRDQNIPVEFPLDTACVSNTFYTVAKGAPNSKNAMRLLEFMTRPEPNAEFCAMLRYLPGNPAALQYMKPEVVARLPDPDKHEGIVRVDGQWEGANKTALEERFTTWLSS